MSELELKVGRTYRGKRPAAAGSWLAPLFNDRTIVWMGGTQVQYDGPSVAIGKKRPTISREAFLKWAGRDVTDSLPADEYEPFKKEPRKAAPKKAKPVVVAAEEEKDGDNPFERGFRSELYWDIRHKSMTPAEVQQTVLEAAGEEPNDDAMFIFRDYKTVGFFTKDTATALEVIKRGCDFLFDWQSGVWFVDMYGHHQIVMRTLQALYTGVDVWKLEYREAADLYIEQCRGFFSSGAAKYGPPTIIMGDDYSLAPELKTAFTRLGYEIRRL